MPTLAASTTPASTLTAGVSAVPARLATSSSSWKIGILVLPMVTLVTILILALSQSYERSLAEATYLSENVARMTVQQTDQTIASIDGTLASIETFLEGGLDPETLASDRVRKLLQGLQSRSVVNLLVILDETGRQLNSGASRRSASDTRFRTEALGAPPSQLFIGHPIPLPGQRWCIPFARTVVAPDGSHRLLVAEVSADAFSRPFGTAGLSPGVQILIERADNVVISTGTLSRSLIGSLAPDWSEADNIVTRRPIPAHPLEVAVSVSRYSALERWRGDLWVYAAIVGTFLVGTLVFAGGLLRSSSRRKLAEADAMHVRLQLQRAIEAMSDGFILADAADRIILCNARFVEFFPSLAPFIIRGEPFERLVRAGAEKLLPMAEAQERENWISWRLGRHRAADEAFELETKDGRAFHVVEQRTPDGETVTLIRDVTERFNNERVLHRAKEVAEEANRSKSDFLANMSHELRTPLNAIIGFAQLLKLGIAGPLTSKQGEYLEDVHRSGELLHGLLTDLLDTARIDAGKLTLHDQLFEVAEILAECLRLVEAQALDAALTLTLGEVEPGVRLQADALRVRQMILNLLTNALKFTPRGGYVTLSSILIEDGGLEIAVSDTGIGIAPEDLPQVLAPFGQVSSVLSRSNHGVGLGLPLTKRLVESHGGRLLIESRPASGTKVILRFPAARVAQPGAASVAALGSGRSARARVPAGVGRDTGAVAEQEG